MSVEVAAELARLSAAEIVSALGAKGLSPRLRGVVERVALLPSRRLGRTLAHFDALIRTVGITKAQLDRLGRFRRSTSHKRDSVSQIRTACHREEPWFSYVPLAAALDEATVSARRHLYDLLCRSSWLPGKNANMQLMWAFAQECSDRGVKGDALALAMASLDADEAPGATELEFLPMCGAAAFAVRALSEPKKRVKYMGLLHECADNLRFRVRDVVVLALAKVGEQLGEVLVEELDGWMDGYFHGTAVLRALAEPGLLAKLSDADLIITRVDQAFSLAKNAERAASRYPGFKALMEALGSVPSLVASRFGTQVFDMLERWTKEKDPALRILVEKNLDRMRGRFNTDVARVWKSLEATKPARRDPTTYVGRGRKIR